MAIYLPRQHLALDIIDDPYSAPVEPDAFPGLTVVPLTCAELGRYAPGMPQGIVPGSPTPRPRRRTLPATARGRR